ncbi:hypothetical protein CRE_02069 [Caenorhabditis remanei]|uniref:Uncharacterized protein n=1 Tax=Caenorhabditis remanei TaxID=31234 RepID=E3LH59_CAERE|nr:hypothetical protein CRE_02069 [Caenorhabditis remanei]
MSQSFIVMDDTNGLKRVIHQLAEHLGAPIYISNVLQEPRGNHQPAEQRPEPNPATFRVVARPGSGA